MRTILARGRGGNRSAIASPRSTRICGDGQNFFGRSCTEAVVRTLHNLDAHIRRRLRVLLLRQWKRNRFIVRRLIRMGARANTAWRVVYEGRKSLWALSHCEPVDAHSTRRTSRNGGPFSLERQYARDAPRRRSGADDTRTGITAGSDAGVGPGG